MAAQTFCLPSYHSGLLSGFSTPFLNVGQVNAYLQVHLADIKRSNSSIQQVSTEIEVNQLYAMLNRKCTILETLVFNCQVEELANVTQFANTIPVQYDLAGHNLKYFNADKSYYLSTILSHYNCMMSLVTDTLNICLEEIDDVA